MGVIFGHQVAALISETEIIEEYIEPIAVETKEVRS